MYEYRYTYITRMCTSTVFGAVSVYLFFFIVYYIGGDTNHIIIVRTRYFF